MHPGPGSGHHSSRADSTERPAGAGPASPVPGMIGGSDAQRMSPRAQPRLPNRERLSRRSGANSDTLALRLSLMRW